MQLTPDQVRHSFRGCDDFRRQGRADFKSPPVDRIDHTAARQTSECPSELNRVGKAHSMRRAPKCHMRQRGRTEQFQGNSLALLQAVYRNKRFPWRIRIDAARCALPYEVAKPKTSAPTHDVVPLHERIKEYAREKAIHASGGTAVEIKRRLSACGVAGGADYSGALLCKT